MPLSVSKLLHTPPLPESVYAELVDDLFSMTPLIAVFAASQCVIGAAIFAKTGDVPALMLSILCILISCERIMMIRRYHRAVAVSGPLSRKDAYQWEQRFAVRSIATGMVISLLCIRCLMLPEPTVHMLVVGVLFSYIAGVVTRVAYRPRLAMFNLVIVSAPPMIAVGLYGEPIYICMSLSTLIFMIGSIDIVRHSYETTVGQLQLKHRFAGLAQRDALTGLSNRLGLTENLEMVMADAQRNGYGLAVHSLDLDRFKAANDLYGHPAGDAILKEVAQRLSRLTRSSDLLVRLGGDEFVLVQTGVTVREQATALAARIVEDIGSYYEINGYTIEIGTSVGIALLSAEELTPDDLLAFERTQDGQQRLCVFNLGTGPVAWRPADPDRWQVELSTGRIADWNFAPASGLVAAFQV